MYHWSDALQGNYTANPNVGSNFGVAGYLEQYAKYNDLDRFLNKYASLAVSQNFTYELINGGLATQSDFVDDDFEANLDIQYAAALGYKQNITYYSTGGRVSFFLPLSLAILSHRILLTRLPKPCV